MDFVVDKEYAVGEVFKHEQTGKTLMCVPRSFICDGYIGAAYAGCGNNFCSQCDRKDGISVIYKKVTGPVEGMLYRVCGRLFKLINRAHTAAVKCVCTETHYWCGCVDQALFGRMICENGWCWELVEEKEARASKAEPKPSMRNLVLSKAFIYENKATFKIVEQSHRTVAFTPNGNAFTAGNGVKIMSYNRPAIRVPEDGHLFVCGDQWRYDNDELACSFEFFNKIKEAVEEYNSTNGCGLPNKVAEVFPEEGGKYFYVGDDWVVRGTNYVGACKYDVQRKEIGNCFKTKEQAEAAAKEIKRCLKEFNEKLGY